MEHSNIHHTAPQDGLKGLKENWRNDLIAGFSVALVALPLGLGIAVAAGAPPMSGILSAILGGLITTFIRSSKIAINGPGNVMIVLIFSAMQLLGDFQAVLAAIVFSGILIMALGALKLGRLGTLIPASVIQGLLAAIGILIMVKQIYTALGTQPNAKNPIDMILEIPLAVFDANPFVTLISGITILILLMHPRIKSKFVHFIPAPIWVIGVSIPLVYLFNFIHPHSVHLFGHTYNVGPEYLLKLPPAFMESFIFPDFSKIAMPTFWGVVLTLGLVNTIETLVSTTAIDKLDPFKRETNLNRDLFSVGLTSTVAGFVGALPVGTVIMRSSVNVNHGAKTRWSNFLHGFILLLCVLFLVPLINLIPGAALAALLVFSGFKLTSPRVYVDAWRKGPEQLVIVVGTLLATLYTNLLAGIAIGMVIALVMHAIKTRMPIPLFLRFAFKPNIQTFQEKPGRYLVTVSGISNFMTMMSLRKTLDALPKEQSVDIDFSSTHLVDLTILEYVDEFADKYLREGGDFHIIGLDLHHSSSDHPHALRVHIPPHKIYSLTRRQRDFKQLAENNGWSFAPQVKWGANRTIRSFQFFDTRPVEYSNNQIRGRYEDLDTDWEVCDLTFDEGALLATEVYRTTVQIIHLAYELPVFTLEQEEIFDKLLQMTGYEDIDFKMFTDFSRKFVIKGMNEEKIRSFFTPRIISYFESEEIYHLESNGHALFIFKYLRLASPQDIQKMIDFGARTVRKLNALTANLPPINRVINDTAPQGGTSGAVETEGVQASDASESAEAQTEEKAAPET